MGATFVDLETRQGQISIPTIWLAVAFSILLHALLLLSWPNLLPTELLSPVDDDLEGKKKGSLAVRLVVPPAAPPVQPPSAPAHRAQPKPAAPTPAPAAPATPAVPRVLTQERPSSTQIAAAPTTAPAPAQAPPKPAASAGGDFAAFVEQRRRQREAEEQPATPQQPPETEQERHNREVARSLGLNRSTNPGGDRSRGGGIFQIISISPERASVAFYGWNKTIERKVLQTIEVSRGDAPSIEVAVVRRMIELIRAQTMGDLTWESLRLGKDVELSARPKDTQKLEAFLMEEFFWDRRQRP